MIHAIILANTPFNSDIYKEATRYIWCLFLFLFLWRYNKISAMISTITIHGNVVHSKYSNQFILTLHLFLLIGETRITNLICYFVYHVLNDINGFWFSKQTITIVFLQLEFFHCDFKSIVSQYRKRFSILRYKTSRRNYSLQLMWTLTI